MTLVSSFSCLRIYKNEQIELRRSMGNFVDMLGFDDPQMLELMWFLVNWFPCNLFTTHKHYASNPVCFPFEGH